MYVYVKTLSLEVLRYCHVTQAVTLRNYKEQGLCTGYYYRGSSVEPVDDCIIPNSDVQSTSVNMI